MAWRWLKSIGLFGGARATLSKGGMGMSWGVPGIRIGRSPSGRFWLSLSIPGTGISIIKDLRLPRRAAGAPSRSLPVPQAAPQPQSSISQSAASGRANPSPSSLTPNQQLLEKIKKTP